MEINLLQYITVIAQQSVNKTKSLANNTNEVIELFTSNKLIAMVLTLIAVWIISQIFRRILNRLSEKYSGKRIYIKTLIPLINIIINLIAVAFILFGIFGVKKEEFITLSISAGLAIGFGGQDLIANTFAGLIIIITRPFKIGDKISVDDYYGEVININLLKVMIVTPDDSTITLPTRLFLSKSISNANSGELNCQVVTEMMLPGNIDLQQIKEFAIEAVYSSPYVFLEKPINIIFTDIYKETSMIKMKIKAYVFDHRYEFLFSSDIYQRLKRHFNMNNIVQPDFYRLPR